MKIGIIGAMDEELASIRQIMENPRKIERGSRTFWLGEASAHEIYLTRCDPGKVNAAIAAQRMIDHFSVDVIFNMGSSGASASELEVGDLVIATEAVQHDFDLTAWGLQPGDLIFDVFTASDGRLQFRSQQAFRTDPKLTQMAFEIAQTSPLTGLEGRVPKVHMGRIISGDQFINNRDKARELWNTHHALCIDMEAAAIAHACEINRVPFLCIRAISDKADHSANISFTTFLVAATSNYGRIFELVIRRIGSAL
jgi:adenosylhomocysteine nucleosidase